MRTFERKWCCTHDRSIGPGGCCSGGLEQPCNCEYVDAVVVADGWPEGWAVGFEELARQVAEETPRV